MRSIKNAMTCKRYGGKTAGAGDLPQFDDARRGHRAAGIALA